MRNLIKMMTRETKIITQAIKLIHRINLQTTRILIMRISSKIKVLRMRMDLRRPQKNKTKTNQLMTYLMEISQLRARVMLEKMKLTLVVPKNTEAIPRMPSKINLEMILNRILSKKVKMIPASSLVLKNPRSPMRKTSERISKVKTLKIMILAIRHRRNLLIPVQPHLNHPLKMTKKKMPQ